MQLWWPHDCVPIGDAWKAGREDITFMRDEFPCRTGAFVPAAHSWTEALPLARPDVSSLPLSRGQFSDHRRGN
jgi:hypothetical protein